MMWLLVSAALAVPSQRFAVLVGANDGGAGRAQLRYAVSDAEAVASVLNEMGGVALGDTWMLEDPSRQDLEESLSVLGSRIEAAEASGARTEVIVYYSGHSDTDGLMLGEERFGYGELRAAIDALPADLRLLVLDSCGSGAIARAKGGSFQSPFQLDASARVDGTAYVTSAAADEVAQEADQVGGSYFTHYLVSGLRGGADTTADGRVTLSEAYSFAYSETLSRTERSIGGAQHANHDLQLVGHGDIVLTDLSTHRSRLSLGEGLAGRLFIHDADGNLVVELDKPPGRGMDLGLPLGSYRLLLQDGDRRAEAMIVLRDGETALLGADDFMGISAELAMARGSSEAVHRYITVGIVPRWERGGPNVEEIHHLDLSLGAAAADTLSGAQLSLVSNIVKDRAAGAQLSVGANVAGAVQGAQLAVGANVSRSSVRGAQLAVGANIAHSAVNGAQLSVGTNRAGEVHGLQAAVGLNSARQAGVQVGVGPNIAGTAGTQLGLLNIAGRAPVQLGIVNVSRDADVQVGLLNINAAGYNHIYVAGSLHDVGVVGATYGGKRLYTVAEVSPTPARLTAGLGLGWHQPLGARGLIDTDVVMANVVSDWSGLGQYASLLRFRAVGGWALADRLVGFAGPTVHWMMPTGDEARFTTPTQVLRSGDLAAGAQAGLRW